MLRAQKIDCFLYKSIFSNTIQSAIRHTSLKEYYRRRFLSYVWLPEIFEFCYLVLHNRGANLFLVYHSWQSKFMQTKNVHFRSSISEQCIMSEKHHNWESQRTWSRFKKIWPSFCYKKRQKQARFLLRSINDTYHDSCGRFIWCRKAQKFADKLY